MMASTIEDLSTEILVEIFSHYIKSEGHVAFSRNVAPVCKKWWDTSSTPSLWNSFHIQNWNYALSVCNRGLLYYTQSLKVSGRCNLLLPIALDSSHLSDVLSSIHDLKSLEISNYDIDVNTMRIVAERCQNLERINMMGMYNGENKGITLKELSPILNICGPKLKHISFTDCHYASGISLLQLLTAIATKCKSLEEFEFNNKCHYLECTDRNMFPMYKFVIGCPLLQKLKLSECRIFATGGNDCSGFKDLTVFKAIRCYSHGVDVCDLLKNSAKLEYLQLCFKNSLVLSDVSKIPSNNLKFLSIWLRDIDANLKAVEEAVDKWKRTLLHIHFSDSDKYIDCTSILRIYLHDNPRPKLKELWMFQECVDMGFLKIFIKECQNLNDLWIRRNKITKRFINREEVLEFMQSI